MSPRLSRAGRELSEILQRDFLDGCLPEALDIGVKEIMRYTARVFNELREKVRQADSSNNTNQTYNRNIELTSTVGEREMSKLILERDNSLVMLTLVYVSAEIRIMVGMQSISQAQNISAMLQTMQQMTRDVDNLEGPSTQTMKGGGRHWDQNWSCQTGVVRTQPRDV